MSDDNPLSFDEAGRVLNDLNTKIAGANGGQLFEKLKALLRGEDVDDPSASLDGFEFVEPGFESFFLTKKRPVSGLQPRLFGFPYLTTSKTAIEEIDAEGYRPGTVWDLIDFGIDLSEGVECGIQILALGSISRVKGFRSIACLSKQYEFHHLTTLRYNNKWNKNVRFLAVLK
jgi:hypothetical protein